MDFIFASGRKFAFKKLGLNRFITRSDGKSHFVIKNNYQFQGIFLSAGN